jgi:UDP-GlcNAc:undecaprenyl-phosphate/decaprenyl-phosphate GlcNAc-1-phosphate transferase
MKLFLDSFFSAIMSGVFTLILVPMLRKTAIRIQLVDKPNQRKLHVAPVPLIGGIAIAMASTLTLLVSYTFLQASPRILMTLGAGFVMLAMGVLDDKLDIRAAYKLIIQLGCAYFIAATGIRITSLYGLFGVHEIAVGMQYLLTVIVIAGVVNAFNLMDGIDGLAGSLALTGFAVLAVLSFIRDIPELAVLHSVFIGALAGFLRFNLSNKKIFMGDGGSLFLGFILVVSGLNMLQPLSNGNTIHADPIVFMVIGIFLLPVLDSLRVYKGRIKNGESPFTADRSHIHHLFLLLGFGHRKTAFAIVVCSILIILTGFILSLYLPLTIVLFASSLAFIVLSNVLTLNKNVHYWRDKIRELENQ